MSQNEVTSDKWVFPVIKCQEQTQNVQGPTEIHQYREQNNDEKLSNEQFDQKKTISEEQKTQNNQEKQPTQAKSWWMRLTRKQKIFFVVMISILGLGLILMSVLLGYFLTLKNDMKIISSKTLDIPGSSHKYSVQKVMFTQQKFRGSDNINEAEIVSITSTNDQKMGIGLISVPDKETGITFKRLDTNNYIIEVDPQQLFKLLETKEHSNKRLLAEIATKGRPNQETEQYHKQIAEGLHQTLAAMAGIPKEETMMKVEKVYIGWQTESGYHIQTQSQRLLLQAQNEIPQVSAQVLVHNKRLLSVADVVFAIVKELLRKQFFIGIAERIFEWVINRYNKIYGRKEPPSSVSSGLAQRLVQEAAVFFKININRNRNLKQDANRQNSTQQECKITKRNYQSLTSCRRKDQKLICSSSEWLHPDTPFKRTPESIKHQHKYDQKYMYIFARKTHFNLDHSGNRPAQDKKQKTVQYEEKQSQITTKSNRN